MMRLKSIIALLLLGCVGIFLTRVECAPPPSVLKIGAILPLTGPLAGAGHRAWQIMNLSLAELQSTLPGILPGRSLELVVVDGGHNMRTNTLAALALDQLGVHGIIAGSEGMNQVSASKNLTTSVNGVGTGTGTAMLSAAIWAANSLIEPLNMLAISSSACSSLAYNDGILYPNLVRMCGKQTSKARAILATFAAFGWNRVAVFSQDGNDGFGENDLAEKDPGANSLGLGQSEADFFIYELSQLTSVEQTLANTLRLRVPAMTSLAREQIPERLQQLKQSGIRIILIFMQGELLSYTMRLASSLGMLKHPYVWVGAGSYSGPESSDGLGDGSVPSGGPGMGLCSSALRRQLADITPSVPSVDSAAGKLISTYQSSTIGATSSAATYVYQADLAFTSNPLLGAICFTPAKPRTPAFVNMKYRLKAGGLNFDSMLNADDAAAYDSILVYAKTFDTLITSGASVSATGRWAGSDVFTTMTQVRLLTEGMTQNIMFDSNGDRLGEIDIYNYDPFGAQAGAFVRRGYWDGISGNLTISDAFIWPDGTFDLPPDYENPFDVGQSITYTKDTSIMALAYFFVLLPSLVLTYNVRKLMKDFIVSIGRDQDWLIDAGRAFVLFSMPGFFAMIYLNLLALTFETGDFMVTQSVFVGGTFFVIVATLFIMPAPILLETYLKARKGSQQVDELMEDFECLFVNGEEVTPAGEATKKEVAKEAKQSRRAKARAARAKAKAGKLIKDDSDGFVERELWNIYDKTTIGMLLTSAIFSAIFIVLMRITLEGLILPVNVKADGGRLFGVWILVLALAHCFLTVIFKDSRNTARLVSAFGLSATLFAGFHSALSCVTFEYTGVDRYVGEASIDNGGIAIAHAILFAIPFFIGLLQLIKALKLSRHSLDAVLNNMKSKLASLETSLETAKADRKVAAQDADHLKRLLELSNLCRPLHRNHALAFTMADTVTETANGGANKIFVPASLQQEAARTPGQAVKSIGTPNGSVGPSTPVIAPSSPAAGRRGQPGLPIPSAGMTSSAASNITGLDFGFLARPKAEMTGYKLLNELSLELFLASGPVHHRAVADIHLSHILSHPLTIEIFKDSLTRSGSQESLALWLDIQRFKQLSDDHLRRQIAEQMVQTFIYSDAPHPINYLKPASRESALNVIFSKKAVKPNTFHFIEQELVARLEKDFANFATSTGFKVCAFLLGHSSYRPSTRIKTLNPGGAVVGDGGKLVQITQVNQHNVLSSGMPGEPSGSGIAAPTGIGGAGAGGPGANDDPQSSLATGAAHSAFRHEMSKGPSVIGVPRPGGANNSGGMQKSPAATNPMRRVTIENAMHKAGPSTPAGSSTGQAEPKTPSGQPAALNLDISIQPQFARGLSVPLNEHQDDELEEDDNDADNDKDSENTPLAPSAASP